MAAISKEEYLKKYLAPVKGGDYKKKKKKRNEKVKAGRGMIIVDDDVSWKSTAPKDDEDELPDALLTKDEKPQIEVIDNRTKEEKIMDSYRKSNKWKTLKDDDSQNNEDEDTIKINDSDSDINVPRKGHSPEKSRTKVRHDSDSDMELPRQKAAKPQRNSRRHDSDSDLELQRGSSKMGRKNKKERHDSSDSDLDMPRHKNVSRSQKEGKRSKRSSDSDIDVPRPRKSRHDSDSDLDIPRSKSQKKSRPGRDVSRQRNSLQDSDSDLELPRSKNSDQGRRKRHDSSSGEDRRKKAKQKAIMGSGGTGGLTSRSELKKELQERKKRESAIDKLANESQKTATVFREKGGKKRDLKREQEEKDAEDAEKMKRTKKYDRWGRGVVQDDMKSDALDDLVHESNKPLARYADDADLDAYQRAQVRDGDPMAAYLAKKKTKQTRNAPSLPKYRGPAPAPNRFHIQPGYRWDGVNRSNGFEKKYYESLSERKALNDEKYKWSVEDM